MPKQKAYLLLSILLFGTGLLVGNAFGAEVAIRKFSPLPFLEMSAYLPLLLFYSWFLHLNGIARGCESGVREAPLQQLRQCFSCGRAFAPE